MKFLIPRHILINKHNVIAILLALVFCVGSSYTLAHASDVGSKDTLTTIPLKSTVTTPVNSLETTIGTTDSTVATNPTNSPAVTVETSSQSLAMPDTGSAASNPQPTSDQTSQQTTPSNNKITSTKNIPLKPTKQLSTSNEQLAFNFTLPKQVLALAPALESISAPLLSAWVSLNDSGLYNFTPLSPRTTQVLDLVALLLLLIGAALMTRRPASQETTREPVALKNILTA